MEVRALSLPKMALMSLVLFFSTFLTTFAFDVVQSPGWMKYEGNVRKMSISVNYGDRPKCEFWFNEDGRIFLQVFSNLSADGTVVSSDTVRGLVECGDVTSLKRYGPYFYIVKQSVDKHGNWWRASSHYPDDGDALLRTFVYSEDLSEEEKMVFLELEKSVLAPEKTAEVVGSEESGASWITDGDGGVLAVVGGWIAGLIQLGFSILVVVLVYKHRSFLKNFFVSFIGGCLRVSGSTGTSSSSSRIYYHCKDCRHFRYMSSDTELGECVPRGEVVNSLSGECGSFLCKDSRRCSACHYWKHKSGGYGDCRYFGCGGIDGDYGACEKIDD